MVSQLRALLLAAGVGWECGLGQLSFNSAPLGPNLGLAKWQPAAWVHTSTLNIFCLSYKVFFKTWKFHSKIQIPSSLKKKKKMMMMMILPILATFLNGRGQQTTAHRDLSAVFINKVLLKHSHAHPFMYCLWLLLLYSGRVDFGTGTIWPQSRKYFQFDPLQKRFADPLDGSSQLHL